MKFTKKDLVKLYTNLVRTRAFDEAAVKWLAEGKIICFYHPALGGEAPAIGGTTFLRPDDIIYPSVRGHGLAHMIGKGISPKTFMAEHCGRATGMANGLGAVHSVDTELGLYGVGATVGCGFVLSAGWALAAQKNGRDQVVVCFFGDGTSNRGTWHEAANMAAVWKLPVVWVCENNGVAQYVSFEASYPLEDLANLASAYGIPAAVVDGQDVLAVAEAVMAAVERARKGKGPSFIECKTLRFGPCAIGNEDKCHGQFRDAQELEEMKKRDSVILFRNHLLEQKVLTQKEVDEIDKEAQAEVAETEQFIDESPFPEDPSLLDRALYA